MYAVPTSKALRTWASIMRPFAAPGLPGRPPKIGSAAWMRRNQLSLDLPDPRNAGFSSASDQVEAFSSEPTDERR